MTEAHVAPDRPGAESRPSATTPPTTGDSAPLIGLVNVLLKRPRLVAGVPLGLAVLAVVAAVARGPRYEAESLIQPQERQTSLLPTMAGLAAQFGINVGSLGHATDPLEFYPRLLRSEALLRDAVLTTYTFSTHDLSHVKGDTLSGTLLDLRHVSGPTEAARISKGVRALSRSVTVRTDAVSGTLTLVAEEPWPELAVQVNRRLLDLMNQFNLQKRQSQALAEATFIEGRMTEARQQLDQAEQALASFLATNRLYQGDPQLVFQSDRLRRRVTLQQQLYASLAQAYDQARIDAVRNTPVITVVAPPEGTARKATGPALYGAVGLTIGILLAVSLSFFGEHMDRQRLGHPEEFARFAALKREAGRRLVPSALRHLRWR
jgi:uncharacterized protein involved in exopolysaccharide biosynthesis